MKPNTVEEAAAVAAFLQFADDAQPATLIGEREVTLIRAAANRIRRDIEARRKGGSVTGRPTGRNGGRPRKENVSDAALRRRESRARAREE